MTWKLFLLAKQSRAQNGRYSMLIHGPGTTPLQIPVQFSLSVVSDSVTPWTAAHKAFLSITNSRSLPKLMSIESVMPPNHLILCRPLLLLPPIPPSIRVFPMSQLFAWGAQSTGVSALASFLPKKSQGWCPSEWTGRISLQSKGLSRFHI